MKHQLRRLRTSQHVLYGNVGMGIIPTVAGLIQGSVIMMWVGITWALVSVAVLVAVKIAGPVLEGVIVDPKQHKLPHVQMHTHRTHELPKAA